ncbi:hormogonium polysaccharide biosynthesis protein HpsA [Pleurocapsa sp. PCC 7327]|uniref:hormogonium polysaccharide biosynthesis protein HpsA n=1 Tax=Pleurocapsa sp. PCC 7327 TaxID=118163 RepID=UPI0020C7C39D|nr:hormogonium polysaccharide biosynthesis protein HpsA [Pleurocapsa sp. PCC 7327]
MSLLKTEKRTKQPSDGSFASNRRPDFLLHRGLRSLPLFSRRPSFSNAGFVLPTIALLLLILSLVVSSMLFRTTQQAQQVIGSAESQKIYNAATPAIERAKAKLEYLFETDQRITVGVPSEGKLESMMRNVNDTTNGILALPTDPYTLPGETRLNLDGDPNTVENAWYYTTDMDSDGSQEVIAYSIMMKTEADINGNGTIETSENIKNIVDQSGKTADEIKAKNFLTRSGPLTIQTGLASTDCQIPALKLAKGWEAINSASVRKNFQIDAVVANASTTNKSVAALELQQDRQMDRGNKWAAWFRDDIDFSNPPPFTWNGAMHSEGSIYFGQNNNQIKFYLVSSPYSCLYNQDASEITINQLRDLDDADGDGNTQEITFQGQAIAGTTSSNTNGIMLVDLFPGAGKKPADVSGHSDVQLTSTTDSVENSPVPYTYSLNPIAIFTEDKSQSRYSADPTNVSSRVNTWNNSSLNKRIVNKSERKPYLDDTYRADNRWGPKPRYKPLDRDPTNQTQTTASNYGKTIQESVTGSKLYNELTGDTPDPNFPDEVGLDGYWERRARVQGLRIIVGQRLELGNPFGWSSNDPLYPPSNNTLTNKDIQRRTLRDNLAAVQATAVYHYKSVTTGYTDEPVTVLATTAHPGTLATKTNSTTFNRVPGSTNINTNFLVGEGTNGWEFTPVSSANLSSAAMVTALTNLARFAGDPDGAFPPKQEATGTIVHPYPYLTMWGDFSNLRRIVDTGGLSNFSALSTADKSTVYTAASMLGMLAYNLDNLQSYDYNVPANKNALFSTSATNDLDDALAILGDGNNSNGEVRYNAGTGRIEVYANGGTLISTFPSTSSLQEAYLLGVSNLATAYNPVGNRQLLQFLQLKEQVKRDRQYGFATSPTTSYTIPTISGFSGLSFPTGITKNSGTNLNIGCDYRNTTSGNNFFGFGDPTTQTSLNTFLRLSTAICYNTVPLPGSANVTPKFPALYYLFPIAEHAHDGQISSTATTAGATAVIQPSTEPYIADTYIFDRTNSKGVNWNSTNDFYKVVGDTDSNGRENGTENGIAAIALQPKARTDWKLPTTTTTNTNIDNKIVDNGTNVYVSLLDKSFYNGRELMGVRTLDLDLNLLRNNTLNGESWIPNSGIVYAFREDAVREDAIARPKKSDKTWSDCHTESELTGQADCQMKTRLDSPQDPPINATTGVSTKPVDFFADPYRRPFGFRLRNGSDLSRNGTERGLSFVSDNPIYIQGNFNLHQDSSGTLQEEFTEPLNEDWNNFYTRETLNTNFAKSTTDRWRATEVIGDAVTILSNNFCDGTVESGFNGNTSTNASGYIFDTNPNPTVSGCPASTEQPSSYLNSPMYQQSNAVGWEREDGSTNVNLPIKIDRNGTVRYCSSTANCNNRTYSDYTNYRTLQNGRVLGRGINGTRVNSIIVSGQIPTRTNQWNGGIINFPRFLEYWTSRRLFIAGAFIQLNYSTYATGPWQHENSTWEPSTSAATSGPWNYYSPPMRRWGYDVALQYAPPGPVAQRFISTGTPRSEVYQERPADDPYIKQLRCATVTVSGNTQKVDKNATDCS